MGRHLRRLPISHCVIWTKEPLTIGYPNPINRQQLRRLNPKGRQNPSKPMDQDRKARTPERGKAPATDSLSIATLCIDKDSAEQIRSFLESMPLAQLVTELQHYLADEQDSVFVDRLKAVNRRVWELHAK